MRTFEEIADDISIVAQAANKLLVQNKPEGFVLNESATGIMEWASNFLKGVANELGYKKEDFIPDESKSTVKSVYSLLKFVASKFFEDLKKNTGW